MSGKKQENGPYAIILKSSSFVVLISKIKNGSFSKKKWVYSIISSLVIENYQGQNVKASMISVLIVKFPVQSFVQFPDFQSVPLGTALEMVVNKLIPLEKKPL